METEQQHDVCQHPMNKRTTREYPLFNIDGQLVYTNVYEYCSECKERL